MRLKKVGPVSDRVERSAIDFACATWQAAIPQTTQVKPFTG